MATFDDLIEVTSVVATDYLIIRRGEDDYKLRAGLYLSNHRPVNSIYKSISTTFDPNSHFVGTWEKLDSSTLIMTGEEGDTIGTTQGERFQLITIPKHTHPLSIESAPDHSHNVQQGTMSYLNVLDASDTFQSIGSTPTDISTDPVENHTHSGYFENYGEEDAYVSVQGRRLSVNHWKRIL